MKKKVSRKATRKRGKPLYPGFFKERLAAADKPVAKAIGRELGRQQHEIELIASENIVSRAVLEAQGSVLTNKYAEGYPRRRYYGGCQFVDEVEDLAIARARKLFDCAFANVQPHSGAQANQAVFFALLQPGDTFMGLNLAAGGHLTHGSPVNQSGKWFRVVPYGVRRDDHRIDYDEVQRVAEAERPKLILAGGSAYPRIIDFARFRSIADLVGAYFMVDMAHFAGLVAGGVHPSPLPHAHVVTTTTHKTLRGPRGGMILSKDEEIGKRINSSVFPGLQGGPLMHVIAAKAVALGEALKPAFKTYARNVAANAAVLARTIDRRRPRRDVGRYRYPPHARRSPPQGPDGARCRALVGAGAHHVQQERHSIRSGEADGDVRRPARDAGGTSRGFGKDEFREVGEMIIEVLDGLAKNGEEGNARIESAIKRQVIALTDRFPIYG